MISKKQLTTFAAAAFTLAIAIGGCAPKPEATQVRVILDYLPNTNHSGMYVALKKGYYQQEGLDVSILQPSEGTSATLIAMGQGEFGVSYQEDVTYARAAVDTLPIKAVAALIQHNDSGFASLDQSIRSPKDFEGRVYGGWGAPGEEAVLKAVMEKQGADFSKLTVMTLQNGDLISAMQSGEVDFGWIFKGWDGIFAQRMNLSYGYLPLRELHEALDYYTPVLIASDKLLGEYPGLAKKFLKATARGYADCVSDPEGAAKILYEYAPEYELDMLIQSQKHLADKYVADAPRWGEMKASVWDAYSEFMRESGLISNKLPSADCFTNEYLPE